jgi:replicative DNA helicase
MPELAYTSNQNSNIERIMPQDIDAEKAVLAAMLLGLDSEVVEEAMMKLKADEFYRPAHRKIFEAMEELYNKGVPIDQLSLADRLKSRGDLDAVGGKAYIVELGNNTYALANWAHHAEIVKREAMLRDLIGAAVRITSLGYDAPDDLDEVVETSEKLLFEVTNRRVATNFKRIDSLVVETFNELQELANTKTKYRGVRTGFNDLDDLFGGLRGGDLVILAARPSVGKTALALNIASRAAQLGTAVAFFSLEMSANQLIQRVLSTETRINAKKMQTGQMSAQDWTTLVTVSDTLSKLKLWVDDTPSASILEVRAKARRQLRHVEPGKGMIIVDYLQLMQPQNSRTESRQVEIAEISRGLKILAKEMDMPIIALSQLSRAVESRQGKRPILSDLRESGAIEQDADIVMFLDRSLSEKEADQEERPPYGTADVIVAKHRNGPIGTVSLAFQGDFTRFDNLAHSDDRY